MSIEAMRYALAALEWNLPVIEDYGHKEQLKRQRKAITAIKQALKQPVQEPVAWCTKNDLENMAKGFSQDVPARSMRVPQLYPEGNTVLLYTTPPAAPVQPVAWMHTSGHIQGRNPNWEQGIAGGYTRERGWTPLYTTPPAQPAPVQEPEYWNVLDPTGNVVASETDAIRGWARIAGSYKPTVEGLLGFHDQGWRVLPKVPPPAQPAVQEPFGYLEIDDIESQREYPNNCRNVNLWHEDGEGMVAIYTTPPEAQRQCTWPTCQSEEYQQALAEQINQELVTGAAQPAPDYAWPTVADYEKDVGFEVNEAFKMAWAMARTTNALFT